jgi:hypothetical protein
MRRSHRFLSIPLGIALALPVLLAPACSREPAGRPAAAEPAGAPAAAAEPAAPSVTRRIVEIFKPEPVVRTVPAGTRLGVRLAQGLSSEVSQVGQPVRAEVTRAVSVGGHQVIPAGAVVRGEVTAARPPKIGGRAQLALRFHTLELPDGSHPVAGGASWVGKSEKGKDIATIAGGAAAGAILGHQADDAQGKGVGGVLGGLAGTAIARKTHGKPLTVPAGSVLEVELEAPVTVEFES